MTPGIVSAPPPDRDVRARILRELAAAVAKAEAPWDTHAVAQVLAALPESSGLKEVATERTGSGFTIELVPAIPSTELAQILGWQNAVCHGQVMTMHLTEWSIWLTTGRNELGATSVARPSLGAWTVLAKLDGSPKGADVDAGRPQTGPPILGRTFALVPADLVCSLRVLLEIAPGAPPVR